MRIQFNSVGYFKSDLICPSWAKLDKNQKETSVFEQDSGRGMQRSSSVPGLRIDQVSIQCLRKYNVGFVKALKNLMYHTSPATVPHGAPYFHRQEWV